MNTTKLRPYIAILKALYFLALITVASSTSPNSYGELADIRMLNTIDSKTHDNILHIDCKKFDISLNFSNTFIKSLGKDFINTPLITCLSFKKNEIESIASGAFDSLPSLEYLNLAGNKIQSLFSFNGHNNLKVLILANQSSYYRHDVNVIGDYPELRYLDLSGNKISTLQLPNNYQNFFNHRSKALIFPRLGYLDLSYNDLTSFDFAYLFNRNLTNLRVVNNNLENIDLRINTNLVELRLDNNLLKAINTNSNEKGVYIDEMPRLKYFSISNNYLSQIDKDVFLKMPHLVTLNLSSNYLEGLFLVLNHEFASLKNVYLDKNKLTSISMSYTMPSLTILSVTHNQLLQIIPNFVNAPILKKLYLSYNDIDIIDKNAFSNLKRLEELHLNNNKLDILPSEWSQNFENLRYLNLSDNNFKTLESLSLSQSLTNIEIDFINIKLTHMRTEVLWNLPENSTIYLTHHSKLFKGNL